MFCTQCGSHIEDEMAFCTQCGTPVGNSSTNIPNVAVGSEWDSAFTYNPHTAFEMREAGVFPHGGASADGPDATVDMGAAAGVAGGAAAGVGATAGGAAAGSAGGSWVSANEMPSAGSNYASDAYDSRPKKKKGKAKIVLLIAIIVLVLGAGGTAAFLFLWNTPSASAVYYSSDETISISPDAVIVAHDLSGEPLDNYTVTISPEDVEEELSWDSASLSVSGTAGFRMSDFQELPEGIYSMTIEQDGQTYYPPDFDVDPSGPTDSIQLQPNPDDPTSATTAPDPEYSYDYVTTSVTIVPPSDSGNSTVEEEWKYPQFSSTSDDDSLVAINSAIKDYFEEKLEATKNWTYDSSYAQCLDLKMTVTYMEDSYVSIRAERYYTYWGAHGSSAIDAMTYDLSTGQEVDPWTILGMTQTEAQQAAESATLQYLSVNPSDTISDSDYEDAIDDLVLEPQRYYLGEEGLIITYYPYELGSFGFGARDIVVAAFNNDSIVGSDVYNKYCEIY